MSQHFLSFKTVYINWNTVQKKRKNRCWLWTWRLCSAYQMFNMTTIRLEHNSQVVNDAMTHHTFPQFFHYSHQWSTIAAPTMFQDVLGKYLPLVKPNKNNHMDLNLRGSNKVLFNFYAVFNIHYAKNGSGNRRASNS